MYDAVIVGGGPAGLSVSLTTWSKDVVLRTDGPSQLSRMGRSRLRHHQIEVVATQIVRVEGSDGVPGLYVTGDASHDVQLAIIAAAEGARAAFAMNKALQKEEQK